MILSICTDMTKLRSRAAFDDDMKARILGVCGQNVHYSNNNKSIVCLSNTTGLEALGELPEITLTSYEEVCGYSRLATEDDELYNADEEVWIEIKPILEMKKLFESVYIRDKDDEGNLIGGPLPGIPGGVDITHLTI